MTPEYRSVPVVPGQPYTLGHVMPTPKRRSRLPLLIVAAVVLVAGLTGAGLYLFLPSTIVVHGDLRLYADSDALQDGGGRCAGHGGYSDIHQGTQVTVTAPDGSVLAFGTLGEGYLENSNTCLFAFSVEVSGGEDSYAFGTSPQRGVIRYTRDDMLTKGVHLTVGG
jgi:hypothetical protein